VPVRVDHPTATSVGVATPGTTTTPFAWHHWTTCDQVLSHELPAKLFFQAKMPSPNMGGSPSGLAAFEYGLWGISFGGSPIGYEGSLSRFQVQGNFLPLCSCTNFVGYSYQYHSTPTWNIVKSYTL